MKKILFIIAIGLILTSCESETHDSFDAQLEVQYYIQDQLKSPSTASFGGETITEIDENTYSVYGYVDAQNGFGATTRKYYECDIEFTPNGKSRRIKNLRFID